MDAMAGMGWMMGAMGLGYVLLIILLALGIAALVKYLFFSVRKTDGGDVR